MKDYYQKNNLPEAVLPNCPVVQNLKNQTAIVTGASSGIGQAIAIAIGKAGANVIVNYYSSPEGADEVVAEVEKCGGKAITFKADVSKQEQVVAMFEEAKKHFGKVDILVNNAGVQKDAAFVDMSVDQWDKVIDINLKGQFLCSQEAVKMFMKQGVQKDLSSAAGKIICISSVHDVIPWAGHVNYAASKGGVSLLMQSIAQEVAPYRIRVNAISPGAIRTPINQDAWGTKEAYADLMKLIPYKRIGEPEEIGRAAVWLASDESDYITGTTLYVDGGMTLYPGFETGG
ncbi:MAG TPA: SDR family oxidoreductase [Vampirovibrionales bacterium]